MPKDPSPSKAPMTTKAAGRIQHAEAARSGGQTAPKTFAARAQRAAASNSAGSKGGKGRR